ncbi:MAG: IS66 family transposase [Planctomycetaceae bacterium]|nr:IS66 family transposase [Planctomycetaceae bacterium]
MSSSAPEVAAADVTTLKAMVAELMAALKNAQQRNAQLEHRLDQILRRMYGQKSEKIDPAQRLLFVDEEAAPAPAVEEPVAPPDAEETKAVSRKKGHGRAGLPRNLPRVRQPHDLTDAEKLCPCCQTPRTKIGEDVSEQLEYVPSSLFVIQHVRPKYACPKCRDQVVAADKPQQPIAKGLPGPGLLAHVAVSKHADHLPLNRQSKVLARHGVTLSRSTLCDWMKAVGVALEPLVALMRTRILRSALIQTDDTPVDVLERGSKKNVRIGRLWVYRGDESEPYVVFDFTPDRSREGPRKWLDDYRGWLQADAYAGYDELFRTRPGLIEVGCWAHARRYFFEARETDLRAVEALAWIQRLYAVEREADEHDERINREQGIDPASNVPQVRDAAHRGMLRAEKSKPLLTSLFERLKTWRADVLPKSPLGQAVQYALNLRAALQRYVDDGRLPIDNNASERDLRGIALGRRNWLFCGSTRGGQTAATITSLIATCQRHRVEPFTWLRKTLAELPQLARDERGLILPDRLAHLLPNSAR